MSTLLTPPVEPESESRLPRQARSRSQRTIAGTAQVEHQHITHLLTSPSTMVTSSTERGSTPEAPRFSNRTELREYYAKRYGNDVAAALESSVQDRRAALEALNRSGLNGQAEGVMTEYLRYNQEFARQERLNETWLQKGWRRTKEAVSGTFKLAAAPFKFAWKSFKKHPVMTTLAIAALAAGGTALAYYLTGNWELFLANSGLNKVIGGFHAGSELLPPTPGTTPLPGGGMPSVVPGDGGIIV